MIRQRLNLFRDIFPAACCGDFLLAECIAFGAIRPNPAALRIKIAISPGTQIHPATRTTTNSVAEPRAIPIPTRKG